MDESAYPAGPASLFASLARQRPEDKTWCPRCQQWVEGRDNECCPTCAWPGALPEEQSEERDRREEAAAAREGY